MTVILEKRQRRWVKGAERAREGNNSRKVVVGIKLLTAVHR